MDLEHIDEVGKEEAAVDVCLDVIRQLLHEPLVKVALVRIVLIVCPVVLEVCFVTLCHFLW